MEDDEVELAAVAAALGDPEFPCCPECRNLTDAWIDTGSGLRTQFSPGFYYQRHQLDSPAKGFPDIVGDRDCECVRCGHRYLFRDSLWLTRGNLSESARSDADYLFPQE